MNGRIIIVLLCILSNSFGLIEAQNTSRESISGFVYDSESEEPIVGTTIYCKDEKTGTVTNNYGYFSLSTPADTCNLSVSFLGYKTRTIRMRGKKEPIIVYLVKDKIDLQEVVVTASRVQQRKVGTASLTMEQIKYIPSLTGETDILKAFQLVAGVQSGSEGSVGLNVRGGSNDQNLYLLDGIPLYYVNHLGGFSSVFDATSVKSAVLYKGFFPASYGGRLSSVMDIVMKDGNVNKTNKEISIGTLSSRFFIEGAIGKQKKTTYIASARVCNLGLVTLFSKNGGYVYYDVNGKITHRIDDRNKIYLSGYTGSDFYSKKDKEEHGDVISRYSNKTVFGNTMGSLKWLHIFNSDISSNLLITYSNFHNKNNTFSSYKTSKNSAISEERIQTSMQDVQIKGDMDIWRFANHKIKIGFVSSLQVFEPQVTIFKEKENDSALDSVMRYKSDAFVNDVYVEDSWSICKLFRLYGGLRLSSFIQKDMKGYVNLEPRVALTFYPFSGTSFNVGYSKMSQYIHLLSNNDGGIPKDLWVPSTNKIRPESSNQYEIEFQQKFLQHYEVSLSAFYKDLRNLIDYAGETNSHAYWEDNIETNGKGVSKGIELTLSKELGKLNGFITYAWSKSTRQFSGINKGKVFPFKYDHTNQVNILLNYRFNEKVTATASWTYHTGNAITMSFEKYQLQAGSSIYENSFGDVHIYKGRNSYRMPAYHRLDLGLTVMQKRGEWHLGIYNVYNRMNPYYYYFQKNEKGYKMKQTTLFPILPSVSYTFKF